MVLTEGRNREIRRMAARIGHKVLTLRRIAFGPLRLGTLPAGGWRPLTHVEVRRLRAATVSAGRHGSAARKPRRHAGRRAAKSAGGRAARRRD